MKWVMAMRAAGFVVVGMLLSGMCGAADAPAPQKGAKPALPIIPGAAGFGMETPAGSGRHLPVPQTTVYKVTNLNDSGSGSLRAALLAKEPRVVVFEVSGYIDLKSGIAVSNPYLTVAGQTAPWPGIVVRGGYTIGVGAHDVLIQHLGFRAGDQIQGRYMPHRGCINTSGTNVVFDHLSAGWSHQGPIDFRLANNCTGRFCIVSEGWYNAGHNEGEHSKGLMIGSGYVAQRAQAANPDEATGRIAAIGNLIAHTLDRNPQVTPGSTAVIANNVVYNFGATGLIAQNDGKGPRIMTVVGNVFAPGIDTGGDPERPWRGKAAWIYMSNLKSRVFFSPDNLIGGKTYENPWEQLNARRTMDEPDSRPEPQTVVWTPPLEIPGYTPRAARETEEWVLANVGPFPAHRGPIDARIVYETRDRTGRGRDDLDDVGGWPRLEENRRELKLPDNPNFVNEDGYTNLERWLHNFADEVEGRKGPVAGADPDLGRREAERCTIHADAKALTAQMRRIQALPKADWTFDAAEAKRRQEEVAKAAGLPVTRTVELGDGVTIKMNLIPPGEFMMGSKYPRPITKARGPSGVNTDIREYPPKRVRITRPYYIGIYEVTCAVWDKVLGTKSNGDPSFPAYALTSNKGRIALGGDTFFINKLNETVGKKEGLLFRLPTEAEWEYACRAGTDTPFWFGETISPAQANYNGAPWYDEPKDTPYRPRGKKPEEWKKAPMKPVGSYAPNPWGLYDTVGNALELAEGGFGVYPEREAILVDPRAPTNTWGTIRIIRGGSCGSYPAECRSGYGTYLAEYGGRETCGLRLVAQPLSEQQAASK